MKFLSKVAEYLQKGLQILGIFGPGLIQLGVSGGVIQTVSKDITEIFTATQDSEAIGLALKLSGPDKLKVLIPKVGDILLQSSALANHKIGNEDMWNKGVEEIAQGAVDCVNSLHVDGIQVIDKKA